jgi:hypothetical protein
MSIDMDRSGWDNPDGFQPQKRETVPVVEVSACEDAGPDGWVCDLLPGHRGDIHRAELGPTWPVEGKGLEPQTMLTLDNRDGGPDRAVLAMVREVARASLAEGHPAKWAIALDRIMELTCGY